jgi:hypothetical protein
MRRFDAFCALGNIRVHRSAKTILHWPCCAAFGPSLSAAANAKARARWRRGNVAQSDCPQSTPVGFRSDRPRA